MNILLVAYYFPPLISGGSQRPARMLKHLTRMGNRVTVLAPTYEKAQPPEANLFRIHDPSCNLKRLGRHRLTWLLRRLAVEAANSLGKYASIYSGWKQNALRQADEVLERAEPEIILATYPPVEALQIGLHLAQKARLPLVADFRDGLLFEPVEARRMDRFACLRREYRNIEAATAAGASAIITISPQLSAYFERAYRLKNVTTIPNGYDEEDLPDPPASKETIAGVLRVVHAGKITLSDCTRSLQPFIAAVERLLRTDPELPKKLQVHFVGQLSAGEIRSLGRLKKTGIARIHGPRDHAYSLALQRGADLFLLITSASRPGIAPGKLFEYLALRKPILALDDGTFAAEIIRETNSGWIVPAHDVEAIGAILKKAIHDNGFGASRTGSSAAIQAYAADRQMRKLNDVLQQFHSASGHCP